MMSPSPLSGRLAVEAAFSPPQIDEMVECLKERGIFAFLNRYLIAERIPPSKMLLIFGCVVVSLAFSPLDLVSDAMRRTRFAQGAGADESPGWSRSRPSRPRISN